jgi:hypothetical protein
MRNSANRMQARSSRDVLRTSRDERPLPPHPQNRHTRSLSSQIRITPTRARPGAEHHHQVTLPKETDTSPPSCFQTTTPTHTRIEAQCSAINARGNYPLPRRPSSRIRPTHSRSRISTLRTRNTQHTTQCQRPTRSCRCKANICHHYHPLSQECWLQRHQ